MAVPVVNTLTLPGGYIPDGTKSADPSGGTTEAAACVGGNKHKAAPHLQPAAK